MKYYIYIIYICVCVCEIEIKIQHQMSTSEQFLLCRAIESESVLSSRLASVQSRSRQSGLSTEVQPLENPISGPWGETHHEAEIGEFFVSRIPRVTQVPCSWALMDLMGSPQQNCCVWNIMKHPKWPGRGSCLSVLDVLHLGSFLAWAHRHRPHGKWGGLARGTLQISGAWYWVG